MLNKIKSLVLVVLVVLVNCVGFAALEPVVEKAAVEESVNRLAAIEVAVADKEVEKCLDIDNLSFFVNGMTVAQAEEAGLYNGEVVELARGDEFIEYGMIIFDYEDNYMTYIGEAELQSNVLCTSNDIFGSYIIDSLIAAVAESLFLVWFFVAKPEEEAKETEHKALMTSRKERDTAEAKTVLKEAVELAEIIESNNMRTYYLDDLYRSIDLLNNCIRLDIVDFRYINTIEKDMKNVAENAYFIF